MLENYGMNALNNIPNLKSWIKVSFFVPKNHWTKSLFSFFSLQTIVFWMLNNQIKLDWACRYLLLYLSFINYSRSLFELQTWSSVNYSLSAIFRHFTETVCICSRYFLVGRMMFVRTIDFQGRCLNNIMLVKSNISIQYDDKIDVDWFHFKRK